MGPYKDWLGPQNVGLREGEGDRMRKGEKKREGEREGERERNDEKSTFLLFNSKSPNVTWK